MSEIRAAEALPALLNYTHDASPGMRKQVVWALATCRADSVDKALMDSAHQEVLNALGDPDADVRSAALLAIQQLGYRGAADAIVRLARDPVPEVRYVAVQALGHITAKTHTGNVKAVSPVMRERIIGVLIDRVAEDPYQSIRIKAMRSLGIAGAKTAIPELERIERAGEDKSRIEARRALDAIRASSDREMPRKSLVGDNQGP